jgi:hypothetical protein
VTIACPAATWRTLQSARRLPVHASTMVSAGSSLRGCGPIRPIYFHPLDACVPGQPLRSWWRSIGQRSTGCPRHCVALTRLGAPRTTKIRSSCRFCAVLRRLVVSGLATGLALCATGRVAAAGFGAREGQGASAARTRSSRGGAMLVCPRALQCVMQLQREHVIVAQPDMHASHLGTAHPSRATYFGAPTCFAAAMEACTAMRGGMSCNVRTRHSHCRCKRTQQ